MLYSGCVYKSTGSWYLIKNNQGLLIPARLKGKLKLDDTITSTNPIAVGDIVRYEMEEGNEKQAVIKDVKDRHNYIVRVAPKNKNQIHILAANLDQAIIITTITKPRTSTGFIDRFLITAEAYHIPALIVVNKTDTLGTKDKEQLRYWEDMYGAAGYKVIALSALQGVLPKELINGLKNKTTLVCGHSGVGKSTLLNRLLPTLNLKTDAVSDYSGKGMHTTTFAEMHDMPDGSRIIDTPGVKELGIIDMEPHLLAQCYPEMRTLMKYCKFNDCTHRHEPQCAVIQALQQDKLIEERYRNYLNIFESLSD